MSVNKEEVIANIGTQNELVSPPVPLLYSYSTSKAFPEDKELEEAAQVFQDIEQMCLTRIQYNECLLAQYQDCSAEEFRTFFMRNYEIRWFNEDNINTSSLNFNVDRFRKIFKNMIENHIFAYKFVINKLRELTYSTVEEVYIALKMHLKHSWKSRPRKPGIHSTESNTVEKVFLLNILKQLRPYIAEVTYDIFKKGYVSVDQRVFHFGGPLLADKEVNNPWNKLNSFFEKGSGSLSRAQLEYYNAKLDEFPDKIAKTQGKMYSNLTASLRAKPFAFKIYTFSRALQEMKAILEIKEALFKTRQAMKPFYETAQELFTIIQQNDLHITKANTLIGKCSRISTGFYKKIESLSPAIKALENCKKITDDFLFIEEAIDEATGEVAWLLSSAPMPPNQKSNQEIQEALNRLEDKVASGENSFKSIIQFSLTMVEANKPKENIQSGSLEQTLTIENISTQKLKPKKTKPVSIPKTWDQCIEEIRKLKEIEYKDRIKSMVEPARKELDLKKVLKRKFELSAMELKTREERIKELKLSKNILELFTFLYEGDFNHDKLVALVEALKEKGEKIELQYPGGGSSHYTIIIIGSTKGYLSTITDENVTEESKEESKEENSETNFVSKGKAYKPHGTKKKSQKKHNTFHKEILFSLQSAFCCAGYTPEALQLELTSKADFLKRK